MPRVKVGDINMYYDTRGEGFPLVLIMGFMGNADCWDPLYFLPRLSEHFKVITFDNRGAGRTDVSDREEYTIRMMADDTAGLMDALGIRRAHVLGISMGGMIAQELAINHPQKVEKLVLASTFCGGPKAVPIPGEAAAMVTEIMGLLSQKGGWDREVASKLLPFIFTEEFMRENPGVVEVAIDLLLTAPTPPEGIVKQVSAILSFDACDRLPSIRAPTLVLAGKKDRYIPPENAEIMAKRIPGAKLVYFEKCAHELQEEIEAVTNTVLEFLSPRR
jgi:pimeloyl-ACP methyl ester carboxylesterase